MGQKLPAFVAQWGTIDTPAFYEGQSGWGNHNQPDPYVVDVNPQYPIGTKFIDGERTFVYGYTSINENASGNARGCVGMMNVSTAQAITALAVVHAVGETKIVLVDGSSTENYWAGGFLLPRVHPYSYYRVLSNEATDSTNTTHTIDRGLITAMAAGEDGFLNRHPYKDMGSTWSSGRTYVSWVGISLINPVASRYQWVQSWGPCYMTGGDEKPGSEDYLRMAQIHDDGTLVWTNPWDATFGRQMAGYVLNSTGSGTTSSWFIYLMINR